MNTAIVTQFIMNKTKYLDVLIACKSNSYLQPYICRWQTNFDENLLSKYQNIKIFSGNISFSDSGDTLELF